MENKDINQYSFEEYIKTRDSYSDFEDNKFLQKVVKHYVKEEWELISNIMKALSKNTSHHFRHISDEIAKRENHPSIQHFDAYNRRIDKIVRPQKLFNMEKEIFSERLFSKDTSAWEQMLKRFMFHHNGEAGIMCPVACTDGLVDLLKIYKDELNDELQHILHHCTEGIDGDFGIGAQFMTEIQGGSNIPANVLKAIPRGDDYQLYGTKFFCSAIHADYAVVTAKVDQTDHIATFIVPSWSDQSKTKRNNFVINRLKWKLGTSELPSAEITYDGAKAYQIGSLEKGVAIAVGIVLTKSRLDIGSASSAFMLRTVREALQYSQFREVFGKKINAFPLAAGQLEEIEQTAKRTTSALFKIYDAYFCLQQNQENSEYANKLKFQVRELILLQKIKASKDTVETIRTAISLFGGNGVIEDFSSIPRLFRDAMVNELWEGPRNVLLTQIHRDMKNASSWYKPKDFITDLLSGCEQSIIDQFTEELEKSLTYNLAADPNRTTIQQAKDWERFCDDLFFVYQDQAFKEVGDAPII
ncbi:acyl-CoA dehydrogenase family protein [Pseudogracilibacillus auburnensis]|uniref:acyl-CoA dehydrogenase family protein n=1 Tax=Pseudogracilibacillus auburnensis TaxID=1494959 RepID=UPI001A96CD2E|nr:acyl-CoA dehydrogenase family protein [Pseudogracilibacillus auburnensis]MBO1004146.1 acyl-CoA dehydrogenase family protein [Pseudogracilibacillus auburnensis]